MKPIFNEEKIFLEKRLGVKIPNNCWRDGSKIYLNIDTKPAIITFKVENNKMHLKNNRIVKIENDYVTIQKTKKKQETIKKLTIKEEYIKREDYLMELEKESIDKTIEYINKYPNYEQRISISGGKDSDLLFFIMQKVYKILGIKREYYKIDVFNTTNDTAQTYLHLKQDFPITLEDIHTPKKGWYRWLKEDKNWFLPSALVRNCCSTFKEGNLKKTLDKNKDYILFLGMRKYESAKRSKYDFDLNEAIKNTGTKLNVPENWKRFLPIVNFKDEDVWLMLLHYNIKFNKMYEYGYHRCGCLICPYASNYVDMLTRQYYPYLIERWDYALEQNYKLYRIGDRLKWTLEEWKMGKWKQGTSKEYDLIQLKPTEERARELAKIKGISEELARRYWDKKCKCGKKLNPDEVAMFLKLNGRFEGYEDNRQYLCKKCMCKERGWTSKEYQGLTMRFRDQGCNLF